VCGRGGVGDMCGEGRFVSVVGAMRWVRVGISSPLERAGKELKFPPTFRRINGLLLSLEGLPFI